jgi:hypothetical protein
MRECERGPTGRSCLCETERENHFLSVKSRRGARKIIPTHFISREKEPPRQVLGFQVSHKVHSAEVWKKDHQGNLLHSTQFPFVFIRFPNPNKSQPRCSFSAGRTRRAPKSINIKWLCWEIFCTPVSACGKTYLLSLGRWGLYIYCVTLNKRLVRVRAACLCAFYLSRRA